MTSTTDAGTTISGYRTRAEHRRWHGPLGRLSEITQPHPTRADVSTGPGFTTRVAQPTIDRIFTSVPVTAAPLLRFTSHVLPVSAALGTDRLLPLSDHLPATVTWTRRTRPPPHSRPIPPCVARLPRFAALAKLRIAAIPHAHLTPNGALRRTKQALRTAAMQARIEHLRGAGGVCPLSGAERPSGSSGTQPLLASSPGSCRRPLASSRQHLREHDGWLYSHRPRFFHAPSC